MALDLEDVIWGNGQNNDGGLETIMYYARISDFATIEALPTATDFSDKMVIAGDHAFNTGKCFKKIGITLEKGSLVSNMVGERNSHSFENMATFGFPGNEAEALAFIEEVKNDDLICLVVELATGQVRQLGSEKVPAHFESGETSTGTAVADFKGNNYVIKSVGRIAPVYTGAIVITPAA